MTIHVFRRHTVDVRQNWGDTWAAVAEDALFCQGFEECCAPSIPSATLIYDYGRIKSHESGAFFDRQKLDLNGWYVKIILPQFEEDEGAFFPRIWYGVIVDTTISQSGNTQNSTVPNFIESGRQTFKALGLKYLLEREVYDSSFAKTLSGAELEFERGIAFNMGGSAHNSRRIQGNMEASGELGTPVFASNLNTALEWNAGAIIDYLLTYHAPADDAGVDRLKWKLNKGESNTATLEALRPKLDVHGQSIKSIIDMVCDRRRSVGWKVSVTEVTEGDAEDAVWVDVFTFNPLPIVLPPGSSETTPSIDPNGSQITIAFANDPRVLDTAFITSSASRVDRVIARGDRVILCLSLQSAPDDGQGTTVKDWETAAATTYNEGASGIAGYSSLSTDDQDDANAIARNAHSLHRVFRFFLWNPATVNTELPVENPAGDVLVNNKLLVCWPPGGRFMGDLPLRYDLDYTTPEVDITDDKPEVSVTEFMPPFGVIKETGGSVYYNLHDMGKGRGTAPLVERHWTAGLTMRRDQLGFWIDVHGQPGQHAIAETEFIPLPEEDGAPARMADLRWQYIIVTVALQLDNWAEATYPEPETPLIVDEDTVKTLIINVPDRQMHYVAKNTVFGLSAAGALFKTSEGGWIRDDSWELKWIAQIAYDWYQHDHRAFEHTFRSLDCPYEVGQLVTELTSGALTLEANSVITSISFDLLNGSYTLKTAFAELDVRGLL